MLDNLQTLLRETPDLPEERIAQEVALLASRSDVREELDRLSATSLPPTTCCGRRSISAASWIF